MASSIKNIPILETKIKSTKTNQNLARKYQGSDKTNQINQVLQLTNKQIQQYQNLAKKLGLLPRVMKRTVFTNNQPLKLLIPTQKCFSRHQKHKYGSLSEISKIHTEKLIKFTPKTESQNFQNPYCKLQAKISLMHNHFSNVKELEQFYMKYDQNCQKNNEDRKNNSIQKNKKHNL